MLQGSREAREVLWSAWEEVRRRLWVGLSRSSTQRELEAWVRRLMMLTDHGDPGYAAAVRYCAGLGLNGGTRDWRRYDGTSVTELVGAHLQVRFIAVEGL